ncbi:hypothetical protein AGENTSMITH_15 [Bacillus phage vB_BspM_AgentSmith]|nr:hypothetical protein AGENTSMITH_15 [Bacillus phage vB_BspM_AgentSmith]
MFDGTGYVACPECRKKDPSEIVEYITNNRLASFPFNLRNNAISEILDVIMHYNFISEMQEKHKEINLSVSTSTDEITLMQFSKLVKGIESCENTRPELKKELIALREEVNQILYNFENGEDQPENSISLTFDKIQQYKKYF